VFSPSDQVRVVQLATPAVEHLVVSRARRPPRLGDAGMVVEVREGADGSRHFLVEAADGDGETIWLAEFGAEELQLESEFESR